MKRREEKGHEVPISVAFQYKIRHATGDQTERSSHTVCPCLPATHRILAHSWTEEMELSAIDDNPTKLTQSQVKSNQIRTGQGIGHASAVISVRPSIPIPISWSAQSGKSTDGNSKTATRGEKRRLNRPLEMSSMWKFSDKPPPLARGERATDISPADACSSHLDKPAEPPVRPKRSTTRA